nr:MAG TPA: hypothetical protein [Caudoviricetes sp.]
MIFFVNYRVVNFSPIWRALCLARSLTSHVSGPVCRGGALGRSHRR